MATNAKNIIPIHATLPGSILKSELQARGMKQKDFAKIINMPAPNLSEIIKGKRQVTEAIALKLEGALGIPYQTWINLQSRYNYVARQRDEIEEKETEMEESTVTILREMIACLRKNGFKDSDIVRLTHSI